ncbi:MAG: GNAT family N-acetyltransferase [Cyanobacteria bacterium P01_A01_bin.105]
MQFRAAHPYEDSMIAEHFHKMWQDIGIPADQIRPDWQSLVVDFIAHTRTTQNFQAFVAETPDGQLVGSASCQLFCGLYPLILTPRQKLRGYIWGVYVNADYRRQGLGRQLTLMAINHLQDIGCTHALLNAAPMGQSVYQELGFELANQMTLTLTPPPI